MKKKDSKQRLFEMMEKVNPGFKNKLNETPFNDAGEPMMTHRQYTDYSEPSEYEYDDYDGQDKPFDVREYVKKELEKNDIALETYNGKEFFIRTHTDTDLMIYFDYENEIMEIYHHDQKKTLPFSKGIDYILKHKDELYSYDEATRSIEGDLEDAAREDHYGY